MAEEPDNIVLVERLARIDARLDGVGNDLRDLSVRLGRVSDGMSVVDARLVRLDGRLERVVQRVEAMFPVGQA